MKTINFLKQSIIENRNYITYILLYLVIIYSLYFFLDVETMIKIGREDGPVEYFTFISFLGAFFYFFKSFLIKKNIFFLLLTLIFLLGAGEEISWGQRIFNFSTPEKLNEINVQKEFNIHNIELFNGYNLDKTKKKGLSRFLTINFLYRLFFLFFGIILPVLVMYSKKIALLTKRIHLPVPPLSIGMFFMVNWMIYKIILTQLLPKGEAMGYYFGIVEVMESGSAFIFFILSLYFFKNEFKVRVS